MHPFNTFYLRYEDGTPYHQFGTTCYAWVHQTRELQELTLQTLAASPFNKIRFCVFPKSYTCLRLSVNQWPDRIKNDSSAGKLVVGKWTFFAATYDANLSQENVCWYFSPHVDAPSATDLKLDRKATYNNGPVGTDLGGLAIGNFNETMHGYGLERQFRGAIRGLKIFGSWVGGRGALGEIKILNL